MTLAPPSAPLAGKRVLVTRAAAQAGSLADGLRARGAEPWVVPVIEIVPPPDPAPLRAAAEDLARYDAVAFTSPNAVTRFLDELATCPEPARHALVAADRGLRVAAVGPGTADALRARGVEVDVLARESRGEGLAAALLQVLETPSRLLLPRALVAREVLPETLRAAGWEVDVVAAYTTVPAPVSVVEELVRELAAGRVDAVTMTSSSSATNLCTLLGAEAPGLLARSRVAAIGRLTAETARALGVRVDVVATAATVPALIEALEEALTI